MSFWNVSAKSAALTALSLIFISQTTIAQPNAGSLQRQIENEQQQLPRDFQIPIAPPMKELPDGGATLTVSAFRFEGNSLLSDIELSQILSNFIGRQITFYELQLATVRIGDAYREAGWVARVFIPEQDVDEGVVKIQIIEARFGDVNLDSSEETRLKPEIAIGYIRAAQTSGELISSKDIDKALLLIDDLPGVTALGNLEPGQDVGLTDLSLKLENEALLSGQVSLDNHGSRSTGSGRINAELYVKSPTAIGDQIRAFVTHSEGNDYIWANYSLPVGYSGLRLSANLSYLEYDVVSSDLSSLDLEGESFTWGINARYPLIRGRTANLYLRSGYDHKTYEDRQSGSVTRDYEIDVLNINLIGNTFDRWVGGGANLLSVTLSGGEVDPNAGASNNPNDDSFSKLNYLLSRQQTLTSTSSIYISLSGQFTDSSLPSAEQFYLGGPTGVRAYPVSEAGGDEGVLATLELRKRLQNNLVLTGFYDWGRITQDINNSANNSPNKYNLEGAGVSLNWIGPRGLTVQGTYSHRFGSNPNPATNGSDQDGSLKENRFWINLSLPF